MRRLLKWGKRSIAAIAILTVLLAAATVLVLNTDSGTRWALARIDAAMAGRLETGNVSGTLWRGLKFAHVIYHDERREISATSVSIAVDWSSVLLGDAAFEEFRAETITLRNLFPPDPEPLPFTLSMEPLPVNIAIALIHVGTLTLPDDERRQIEDIKITAARLDGNVLLARMIVAAGFNLNASARNFRLALRRDVSATADINWTTMDGIWSGQGSLKGTLALLAFEQVVEGPYPFTAVGDMKLLNYIEPEFDAKVTWDTWTVSNYRVLEGTVRLQGNTTEYVADYHARAVVKNTEIQVDGSGRGDLQQLTELTVQLDADLGHADVRGTLSWLPEFSTALRAKIDGELNGAPLRAEGGITLAGEQMSCSACSIAVGENRLRIDGQSVDNELALSVFVDAPNVQQLWPDVAGAVHAEGRLTGPLQRPSFTGALQGRRLVFQEWAAESVAIDSHDSGLDSLDIRIDVADLSAGDADYGTFKALGKGRPEDLQFSLEWLVRGFLVDAGGTVGTADTGLTGTIGQATISKEQLGDWQLQSSFGFEVGDNEFLIQPHIWSGKLGELRVSRLTLKDEEMAVVAGIEELPLSVADAFLPAGFGLLGTATANVDVVRRAGLWLGTFGWRQSDTLLRVADVNEQTANVGVPRAEIKATFQNGGVAINATVEVEPGLSGEINLQLVELSPESQMTAEMLLLGEDWGWISAVVPAIDVFEGAINASVSASGILSAPEFSGNIVWSDGKILLPALNVPLEDVSLRVTGTAIGSATLLGSARAGSGMLVVAGSFDELMQPTRSVTLTVSGASAEVINWPEYRLWASPDLTLVGDSTGWRIDGAVTIPRAEVNIREIPVEAITPSADVIVLGEADIAAARTRIIGETRVKLGDRVRIKALGLDSGLAGELLVKLHADREPDADGRITLVDGNFAAHGQKLTIQKGDLTFTGPLDNPIVDVRAVRVIDTIEGTVTAGIHLHGRAQDLTTSVFSEPAMNEVDALSYLVIGRPLNRATEEEGGQLSGAAVSMGLRQASRLTDQIGQTLGLDQLSLTGDGGDTTALIAGKKISSRLHARYAYGVFSRLGVLLLRYRLSDRVSLEAGAGESQSIDVLYSVEKR